MELTYTTQGDYQVPELTLPEETKTTYGHYGRLRKSYLEKYRHGTFSTLLLSGKLNQHLM
ncbi:TnpV protein, partial [Caproiciproducens sp.]|uniref:TnpV protein n=1 Tax=Caproiciproducens sp. TaxID=1954376 RepID=UPI003FA471FB